MSRTGQDQLSAPFALAHIRKNDEMAEIPSFDDWGEWSCHA